MYLIAAVCLGNSQAVAVPFQGGGSPWPKRLHEKHDVVCSLHLLDFPVMGCTRSDTLRDSKCASSALRRAMLRNTAAQRQPLPAQYSSTTRPQSESSLGSVVLTFLPFPTFRLTTFSRRLREAEAGARSGSPRKGSTRLDGLLKDDQEVVEMLDYERKLIKHHCGKEPSESPASPTRQAAGCFSWRRPASITTW